MKNKPSTVELLSGYMRRGTIYTFGALIDLCKDNGLDSKNLKSELNKHCKQLIKVIEKYNESKAYGSKRSVWYRIVPGTDLEWFRSEANRRSIVGMAQTISKLIHEEHKKTISSWINDSFESKLTDCVQDHVKLEFQNEILPILKDHIEKKMENLRSVTKDQIKECIKEIILDVVKKLDGEE